MLFLVKEIVPSTKKGIPVPVERSWSSLKGVLRIYNVIERIVTYFQITV